MGNYALMIVFTLSIALASYTGLTKRNLYQAQLEIAETYNRSNAKNIAQSVASIVIKRLEEDTTFAVGANSTKFIPSADQFEEWGSMNGSYQVELTNYGDTSISVEVNAKAGLQTYTQSVTLGTIQSGWNPDLSYTVFSYSDIELSGGARIKGHVATNSKSNNAVNLSGGARIDSNLFIGPGARPAAVVRNARLVRGDIFNLRSELNYEVPEFPDLPEGYRRTIPIYLTWFNRRMILRASDYREKYFPSINVRNNYNISFDTGASDKILFVKDLNVTQGDIKVIGDGRLIIFVDGKFVMNGSSTINANTQDSEKVIIYYAGTQDLSFGGATKFYGDLYIESANITITGSGGVQGHILTGGDEVNISGAGKLNGTLLFAPNADVTMRGGARMNGAIISNTFTASGGASVDFSSGLSTPLPDFGDEINNSFAVFRWY